jgi:type I restriction enzyme M protein
LLHGIERPNIVEGNRLQTNISQIKDDERVDVIATNPPFGGEEEPGILNNFPQGLRTRETAILFLQYVMAMLRHPAGRCGIVLPDGFLFGDGVAREVRKRLIERFNLHTIVRLPPGVFAPYADIPTNILFFEAPRTDDERPCTKEVWYYEHALPEGQRSYTKTRPLRFEEFDACLAWWNSRQENDRAWRVPVRTLMENDYNLDIKNPSARQHSGNPDPEKLMMNLLRTGESIISTTSDIRRSYEQAKSTIGSGIVTMTPLRELLTLRKPDIAVDPTEYYQFAGVYSFGRGAFRSQLRPGAESSYRRLTRLREGNLVYPKLMAWEGAIGIVPAECDGCFVSTEYPVFEVHRSQVLPEMLDIYFRSPKMWPILAAASKGTNARRRRLHPDAFLALEIPLLPMEEQEVLRDLLGIVTRIRGLHLDMQVDLNALLAAILSQALGRALSAVS